MAENEVKIPDLFNRSPGSQNLVEYFIKKKDSRISTRCLAVVNEEALAEFCRVVTLRSIKVDPYCEGEEPGDDGAGRCLPGRVSQQSSYNPHPHTFFHDAQASKVHDKSDQAETKIEDSVGSSSNDAPIQGSSKEFPTIFYNNLGESSKNQLIL